MGDFETVLLANRTPEYINGFNTARDSGTKNCNPHHSQFSYYEYSQWAAGFDDNIRFKNYLTKK